MENREEIGQRKPLKDYINYEPSPEPERILKTAGSICRDDPEKDAARAKRKEEREDKYGKVAEDRKKVRPKRSRPQIMHLPTWPSKLPHRWLKSFVVPDILDVEQLSDFETYKTVVHELRSTEEEYYLQVYFPKHREWRNAVPVHPTFIRTQGSAAFPEEYRQGYEERVIQKEDLTETHNIYYGPSVSDDEVMWYDKDEVPSDTDICQFDRKAVKDENVGEVMPPAVPPTTPKEEPTGDTDDENDVQADFQAASTEASALMISDDREILALEQVEKCVALIVDTGATASVIGVTRAEQLSGDVNGLSFEHAGKSFRSASGNQMQILSAASFEFPDLGQVTMSVLDNGNTPALLGQDYLADCIVNMAENTLTKNGRIIPLKRLSNGHRAILIPVSKVSQH